MTDQQPIIVAKIGAPHGVRGDLKLHSFTEDPQRILDFKSLLIEDKKNQFKPLSDYRIFSKGDGFFIAFDDCADRDLARAYTHKSLAVTRADLGDAAADEIYWNDLEGLKVINQQGIELGVVEQVFDTGSNDVLVVKGELEHLIPYVAHHVFDVDLKKGTIEVDWDEDF